MYHFELRKFPHTVSRFNQSERQVLALVMPWTREEWVEVGERKWNVNETKLTVLEGPELSLQEMAMNRGWRNALRRSDDVTERVLTAVREHQAARRGGGEAPVAGGAPGAGSPAAAAAASGGPPTAATDAGGSGPQVGPTGAPQPDAVDAGLLVDSLALELVALLADGALTPARAWELAQQRAPERAAPETIALAQGAIESLLDRGLATLTRDGKPLGEDDARAALRSGESWMGALELRVVRRV